MEETRPDVIRIEDGDEITDIISRIALAPERTVTLSIPKSAAILQDVTNLKILQRKAEELGKEITISKANLDDLYEADTVANVNLAASAVSSVKQNPDWQQVNPPMGKRFTDIVRKSETVDLRKIKPGQAGRTAPIAMNAASASSKPAPAPTPQPPTRFASAELTDKRENKVAEAGDYFANLGRSLHDSPEPAEKKPSVPAGVRRIEREELFGENDRLRSDRAKERFDFSYNKTDKKKRGLIPTISARVIAAFILLGVLTASLALFFILPKATIAVTLKSENAKGEFSYILDKDIAQTDAALGRIPVLMSESKSEKSQSFEATGKKRLTTKATGSIVIYNECSTGSQPLVAGTRLQDKTTGKVFKLDAGATIPGFSKPEDAVVPGTATVKVTATAAGEDYNIKATAFTFPGLQETSSWKYSCLYARSTAAMAGGSDKEVAVVTADDLKRAESTLTDLVKADHVAQAASRKDDGLVYVEDAADEGVFETKTVAKADDVMDKFELSVTLKKASISLKKSDLESLLGASIVKQAGFNTESKPIEGSLQYQLQGTAEKDNQLVLSVDASQKFAFQPDTNQIKKDIAGKNRQELNAYFTQLSGVKSASVRFWPWWVDKVPKSFEKINISLDIDDSV